MRSRAWGLIPTHAGKTSPRRTRRVAPWAHPHSRGENARFGRANPVPLGSSPLTRGKPVDASRPRRPAGLIPTHAGKTNMDVEPSRGSWAHPHSRGENVLRWAQPGLTLGSSPLTRGKPAGTSSITRMEGLIPTHAGKTLAGRFYRWNQGAHPHSRGENAKARGYRTMCMGSSPLTRGKLVAPRADLLREGLIPTHAGKTTPPPEAREPLWAHPHSRGENVKTVSLTVVGRGSSPLTRGKLLPRACESGVKSCGVV